MEKKIGHIPQAWIEPETKVLWTVSKGNDKTGKIPGAWVGDSKESCKESCIQSKCPLFNPVIAKRLKLRPCYAHRGLTSIAHTSVIKAAKRNPQKYTQEAAFARSPRSARMARLSVIGNIGICSHEQIKSIKKGFKKVKLGALGYFAGWRKYPHLRDFLMASTFNFKDADAAIRNGCRPATVLPEDHQGETFETPAGNVGIQCPAIFHKTVNCNQCGLCVRKWNPIKSLKRLKSMGIISNRTYRTIKQHKQATNLIIGFVTHQ
jgi:hypothetical protein